MGDFANRLAAMNQSWSERGKSGASVPPGIYTMLLQSAELGESQSSNKLQIHREHLILEGEYQGQVIHDYLQLETEMGPRFVSRWIELMGFTPPDDPQQLEDVVAAIAAAAPTYQAQVKVSGDFTNVNIRKLLSAAEAPPAPTPAPVAAPPKVAQVAKAAPVAKTPGAVKAPVSSFTVGDCVVFKDGATNVPGTVESLDTTHAVVKDDQCSTWKVALNELRILPPVAAAAAAPSEKLTELLAFAQSQDIAVDDSDTEEMCIAKIKEFNYDVKQLTPEEIVLLTSIGAVAPPVAAKPSAKVPRKK
jgi:hypothetical protein